MKKNLLLLFNLVLLTNVVFAQQSQEINEEWVAKKDGHGEWDNTNDLQVTPSGDVYITGYSQNSQASGGYDYDAITTKYNSQGVEVWSAILDAGIYTYIRALDVANDGSVVITGQHYQNNYYGNQTMITAKYSANGTLLWTASINGTGSYNYAYGMDVKVDAVGNTTAFGYGYDNNTWGHILVKYDVSGNEIWRQFTAYNNSYFQKMDIDAAGNCYLMGYKYNYNYAFNNYSNYHDIWVEKFNANGGLVWDHIYDAGHNEYTTDAVVTDAGDVYLTAHQNVNNGSTYGYNFLTMKINTDGTLLWEDAYGFNQQYSYPQGLDVSANGNVAVVGYVSDNNGSYGYSTITYDANGTNLWSSTSQANMSHDYAMDVAMGDNGDVFVTGYSYNENWSVLSGLTVKYDASTGTEEWFARYGDETQNTNNSYRYAYGQYIDVDASNSAYVGMYDYTYDYNNYYTYTADYTTVKYVGSVQPLVITGTTVSDYAGYGVTCNGANDGSIDVAITGGSEPYIYTVNGQVSSNPVSNLTAGTYTIVVTDGSGQSATTTAVITEPVAINCAITSVPSSTVFTGGNPNELYLGYGAQSTTLATTVSEGGVLTYAWTGQNLSSTTIANPVFTPTAAGNYSFTVLITNARGCVTSCTIDICVYDIRVPGTNGKKVFICHVPEGNPSNANTLSVSVSAVPSHIGLHGGDRLGECNMVRCTPVLRSMEVEEGHDHVESLILSVYPNPNNGIFSIKSNMVGTYTLINELGQEVRVFELNEANNFSVNVTDLVDGMYFVYGVNNNEIVREKIVITK